VADTILFGGRALTYPVIGGGRALTSGAISGGRTQSDTAPSTTLAFLGAEGYGAVTRHAWGSTQPTIYFVTSVANSGAGTLREALEAAGPRVILFETSGTITLSSEIVVTSPYVWVAGQTAPSPGIQLAGYGIQIKTNDVLLEQFRIRPGASPTADKDALMANTTAAYNLYFKHLTLQWAVDGTLDFAEAVVDTNATVDSCLLTEHLHTDGHTEGAHSWMMLIAGGRTKITMRRNMLSHAFFRMPKLSGGNSLEEINNVLYDFGSRYAMRMANENVQTATLVTHRGNVYKQGGSVAMLSTATPIQCIRVTDNCVSGTQLYDNDSSYSGDDIDALIKNEAGANFTSVGSAPVVSPTAVTVLASGDVMTHVTTYAGARSADRDSHESRVMTQATAGTGTMIDDEDDVGGYPTYAANTIDLDAAIGYPASPHAILYSGSYQGLTALEGHIRAVYNRAVEAA